MGSTEKPTGEDRRPDARRGVFETILIVDNEPVELDAHLERLAASTNALYDRDPPDARELVIARARGGGLGRLRLTIEPRHGDLVPTIVVAAVDPNDVFPSADFEIALEPMTVSAWAGDHKWADRDFLARAEASCGPRAVPLLVAADGAVLEASRANLFAVIDGRIETPPLDGRILPGITRRRAIEAAAKLGVETEECVIDLDRLLGAEEVFLTGSIRGIEPVRAIDDREIARGRTVTGKIAAALHERWFDR